MSAILEVIIGLVFVYSLLSILVTQINSLISEVLNLRSKFLRDGLDDLLTDPVLRAKVFAHPLVRLIPDFILPEQRISEEEAEKAASGKLNRVDWIDPETFVSVLMNVIKADADQDLFGVLMTTINDMPSGPTRRTLRLIINRIQTTGQGLQDLRDYINQMEDTVYKQALRESLDKIDDEIGQMGLDPTGLISVVAGLRKVKNPFFQTAMEAVLSTSKTIEEAKKNLSKWFNDGMQRSSQAYGRRMQFFSLLIGFLIALIANVDSLQVARALWEDPVLRASVSAIAQDTDLSPFIESPQEQPVEGTDPATGEDPVGDSQEDVVQSIEESLAAARETLNQINELRLPIGWQFTDPTTDGIEPTTAQLGDARNLWNYFPGNNPDGWLGLLLAKLLGLGATMIAIAQGAPFWFNILNRLTSGGKSSSDDKG